MASYRIAFDGSKVLVGNPGCYAGHRQHDHSEFVDDSALIQFVQAGCEKCFEVLFARYWKLVFAISWRILRRRTDAEDLVQEVFLTIYLQSGKYDSTRGSLKTWIAQFAHFKALMRRKYIQTRELTKFDELTALESERPQSGPRQSVFERSALVREYLSALNPRQRRTVELIHFDGYTLLETAEVLGQSLANTRNLYYRGMKALRARPPGSRGQAAKNRKSLAGTVSDTATSAAWLHSLASGNRRESSRTSTKESGITAGPGDLTGKSRHAKPAKTLVLLAS